MNNRAVAVIYTVWELEAMSQPEFELLLLAYPHMYYLDRRVMKGDQGFIHYEGEPMLYVPRQAIIILRSTPL